MYGLQYVFHVNCVRIYQIRKKLQKKYFILIHVPPALKVEDDNRQVGTRNSPFSLNTAELNMYAEKQHKHDKSKTEQNMFVFGI